MRQALLLAASLVLACPAVVAAPCPLATGDVAPGDLVAATPIPRFVARGNGVVDIGDTVALLRTAVGLQAIDGPLVGGDCPSLPGDLAPGLLDTTTTPPTWRPRGDGVVNVADIVVHLRATLDLVQLPAMPVRMASQLQAAASCDELLAGLRDTASRAFDMNGGWGGGWWWGRWGGGPLADADMGGMPTAGAEGSATSYSSTNVQESGVDEADIVKTDGSLLLALSGRHLRVLRAWPVASLALLSSTEIEGWPTGLFMERGHAVVLSQVWSEPAPLGVALADLWIPQGLTKLTVLDLADPSAPRITREIYVDGWLQASRQIAGRTVLVFYHALQGPPMPPWTGDEATWRQAVRAALAASTLDDWLPQVADVRHVAGGGATTVRGWAVSCEDVRLPADLPPPGLVSVLELDAVVPGPIGSAAVVGAASTVYVAQHRLFVTMDDWMGAMVSPDGQRTRIHAFAINDGSGEPRYLGVGHVSGWVGTPWSLSEDGTALRVATTTRDANWRPSTNVFVLQPNGTGDMEVAGSLAGLAPGETLQSARFMGDRGYLVTFERKDPLFVLDLSDDAHPRVTGELVVNGWSSYLHPLGGDHLIGIGRDVDPATQQMIGMQVSLFDVTDPAVPLLDDRHVEPVGWNGSEAEWDHHAFNWFDPLGVLAVPLVTWDWWSPCPDAGCDGSMRWTNELKLYRIAPGTGVEAAGSLDLTRFFSDDACPDGCGWCAQVRRSVFLEDHVVAITDAGVVGARVDTPSAIAGSVTYPDWTGCGGGGVIVDPMPGDGGGGMTGGDPGAGSSGP